MNLIWVSNAHYLLQEYFVFLHHFSYLKQPSTHGHQLLEADYGWALEHKISVLTSKAVFELIATIFGYLEISEI